MLIVEKSAKKQKNTQQNFTFKENCRSIKSAPVKNNGNINYEKSTTNEKICPKGFYAN